MALVAKANNYYDAFKSDEDLSSQEKQPNFKPTASDKLAETNLMKQVRMTQKTVNPVKKLVLQIIPNSGQLARTPKQA